MTSPTGLEFKTAAVVDAPAATDAAPAHEGVVEALVAVTGVRDDVGDVIVPGAFARTLKDRRPKVCLGHDWNRPIGRVLAIKELLPGDPELPKTTADGRPWPAEAGAVWARYQANLATKDGLTAFLDAQFFGREESTFSIGYKTVKARHRGDTRFIEDIDLFEFGPVLHPANRLATLLSTKGGEPEGIEVADLLQSLLVLKSGSPDEMTNRDSSASLGPVDTEYKARRYVQDSTYWGYPKGTLILPGMKPRGKTARTLRARGVMPSRNVGVAETEDTARSRARGGRAADVAIRVGDEGLDFGTGTDDNGLTLGGLTSDARVRARNPKGKDDRHLASLRTSTYDDEDGETREKALEGLLDEGITPAELREDLTEPGPDNDGDELELEADDVDDIVDDYTRRYRALAAEQAAARRAPQNADTPDDTAPKEPAPRKPRAPRAPRAEGDRPRSRDDILAALNASDDDFAKRVRARIIEDGNPVIDGPPGSGMFIVGPPKGSSSKEWVVHLATGKSITPAILSRNMGNSANGTELRSRKRGTQFAEALNSIRDADGNLPPWDKPESEWAQDWRDGEDRPLVPAIIATAVPAYLRAIGKDEIADQYESANADITGRPETPDAPQTPNGPLSTDALQRMDEASLRATVDNLSVEQLEQHDTELAARAAAIGRPNDLGETGTVVRDALNERLKPDTTPVADLDEDTLEAQRVRGRLLLRDRRTQLPLATARAWETRISELTAEEDRRFRTTAPAAQPPVVTTAADTPREVDPRIPDPDASTDLLSRMDAATLTASLDEMTLPQVEAHSAELAMRRQGLGSTAKPTRLETAVARTLDRLRSPGTDDPADMSDRDLSEEATRGLNMWRFRRDSLPRELLDAWQDRIYTVGLERDKREAQAARRRSREDSGYSEQETTATGNVALPAAEYRQMVHDAGIRQYRARDIERERERWRAENLEIERSRRLAASAPAAMTEDDMPTGAIPVAGGRLMLTNPTKVGWALRTNSGSLIASAALFNDPNSTRQRKFPRPQLDSLAQAIADIRDGGGNRIPTTLRDNEWTEGFRDADGRRGTQAVNHAIVQWARTNGIDIPEQLADRGERPPPAPRREPGTPDPEGFVSGERPDNLLPGDQVRDTDGTVRTVRTAGPRITWTDGTSTAYRATDTISVKHPYDLDDVRDPGMGVYNEPLGMSVVEMPEARQTQVRDLYNTGNAFDPGTRFVLVEEDSAGRVADKRPRSGEITDLWWSSEDGRWFQVVKYDDGTWDALRAFDLRLRGTMRTNPSAEQQNEARRAWGVPPLPSADGPAAPGPDRPDSIAVDGVDFARDGDGYTAVLPATGDRVTLRQDGDQWVADGVPGRFDEPYDALMNLLDSNYYRANPDQIPLLRLDRDRLQKTVTRLVQEQLRESQRRNPDQRKMDDLSRQISSRTADLARMDLLIDPDSADRREPDVDVPVPDVDTTVDVPGTPAEAPQIREVRELGQASDGFASLGEDGTRDGVTTVGLLPSGRRPGAATVRALNAARYENVSWTRTDSDGNQFRVNGRAVVVPAHGTTIYGLQDQGLGVEQPGRSRRDGRAFVLNERGRRQLAPYLPPDPDSPAPRAPEGVDTPESRVETPRADDGNRDGVTARIEASEVDSARDLADESIGLTEDDDGELVVTPEVAERQARVERLIRASDSGTLDLAARSDTELVDTRRDVAEELRLQNAVRRRDAASGRPETRRARTAPGSLSGGDDGDTGGETVPDAPALPRPRPGVAGAAEDYADALDGGDQDAIDSARDRMLASLRRSRSDSESVRALRELLESDTPAGQADLRRLAEALRVEARERRNASARARRTVKRLERERLRALLGSIDAELRGRGVDLPQDPVDLLDDAADAVLPAGQAPPVT